MNFWKCWRIVANVGQFLTNKDESQTYWVFQWLGIYLQMQRTHVQSLIQEAPTYLGVAKSGHHSY